MVNKDILLPLVGEPPGADVITAGRHVSKVKAARRRALRFEI